ncbi:MAG: hypothetical protein JSW01_02035 [Candidatus Bathyarchaeota archaeon]|nr:MAG: hypothetical protein JSW01_02035 [Candidatus Bathyarchaeota archaeon]
MEREVRNRGLGLLCYRPCFVESVSKVEVTTKTEGDILTRTYTTPVGSITERLKFGVGYGQGRYGRDWKGMQPRRIEFAVKNTEDYDVLKFIIENTHYEPYYFAIEDQQKRLGDDGIVVARIGYSPFQRLLIQWVGPRLYIHHARQRELVDAVYSILEERCEAELFPIAADSPTEVVLYGDNIDGVLVSPQIFEEYHLPSYTKCAEMLHAKGKLLDVHMDGRLKNISSLIANSDIDIVEAFTPPPMGDFSIEEALSMWKEKILWVNFPSSVSVLMGPSDVKKYLVEQLKLMIPGARLLIIASTENYLPEENLRVMTEVMQRARLPLSKEEISAMETSLD